MNHNVLMSFKAFSKYEVEDFLEEESFRTWVQAPTKFTDQYWREFLELYPKQSENVQAAKQLIQAMEAHFEVEAATVNEQFSDQLRVAMQTAATTKRISIKRNHFVKIWSIAGAIIFLLGFGFGIWYHLPSSPFPLHYTAAYGEWKTINLPDGSIVSLNANSTLQLTEHWDNNIDREVWLKGEAFFDITHYPATKTKFLVHTDDLTIEVLGTQFNVQTTTTTTEVFLEKGKIQLNLADTLALMRPRELVTYSKQKKKIIHQEKEVTHSPGTWRTGILTLKNQMITHIAERIEEIYGLEVVIKRAALKNEIRTIAIPIDRLDLAIPILETTLQADIEKRDRQLIIN